MQPSTFLWLGLGIAGTWIGAELLVRGSARIALSLGIRPMVVGLTVVAFGTSSPEAVVSFLAAAKGSGGIAVGNVFGSNIANIGLILGVVALMHPLRINWLHVRTDAYLMLAATVISAVIVYANWLDRPAGLFLLGLLCASIIYYARSNHAPGSAEAVEARPPAGSLLRPILQSVAGFVILIGGANRLVAAAEIVARSFGIPDEVIGSTMVAVGTSLPELAASIVAVARGHHDIGIGNIVGSNQMNLLFVLGGVCTLGPVPVSHHVLWVIVPVTLVFTVVLLPMLATGGRVGRREGVLLLVGYIAFAATSYF